MALSIASPAFPEGGSIPARHTCEGDDLSPPLRFAGIPTRTRSLALIIDDPDAPDPRAPKRTWVHWVVYNLPANVTELAEGASSAKLPGAAREGLNDSNQAGYHGPCPPVGTHRYFHKLYALDTELPDLGTPTKAQLEAAMRDHVLERAELIGLYGKPR
jgi:Raf kinase inhibitor-like YbhB/YbcL family protein